MVKCSGQKNNIHAYSIEVRYLSVMPIGNPLHARVYWPFQGGASFVFMFHVSLCYAILSVLCGLVVGILH